MEPPCISFQPENGLNVELPLIHSEFCLWLNRMKFFLILAGIIIAAQSNVYADEAGNLQIHMGQKVMYCAARINVDDNALSVAINDGVLVSTEWHIHVSAVRKYWLNKGIADITAIRSAKPDLLTRSWLLTDASSGISRRVYRIEDAIYFLSSLEGFPVLDKSLLLPGVPYKILISVDVHIEGINNAWWAHLWHTAAVSMQQDFALP